MITNRSIMVLLLVMFCAIGVGALAATPILFRDNFNSSASDANWKTVIGTWIFQRGKLIGTPEEEGPPDAWIYVAPKQFPGNIEVKVIYDQAEFSDAGIVFNSTRHLVNEYRATVWSRLNFFFPNRWSVAVYQNGVVRNLIPPDATDVIDNTIPSPFPIPTRGHFSVRRVGNTISLYVNGRQVGSVTDTDPLPARGKVGLIVSDATTTYDNFQVRKIGR